MSGTKLSKKVCSALVCVEHSQRYWAPIVIPCGYMAQLQRSFLDRASVGRCGGGEGEYLQYCGYPGPGSEKFVSLTGPQWAGGDGDSYSIVGMLAPAPTLLCVWNVCESATQTRCMALSFSLRKMSVCLTWEYRLIRSMRTWRLHCVKLVQHGLMVVFNEETILFNFVFTIWNVWFFFSLCGIN